MKHTLTVILLFIINVLAAQYYAACDNPAVFNGGEKAIEAFVNDSIIYYDKDLTGNWDRHVVAHIYIDSAGHVVKANVEAWNANIGEQVESILKELPDFKPAMQKNKVVAYKLTMPIHLKIDDYSIARSKREWPKMQAKQKEEDSLEHQYLLAKKYAADKDASPAQIKRKRLELMVVGTCGEDGYQTKFTDMDLNFVEPRVKRCMNNWVKVGQIKDAKFNPDAMTMTYAFESLKVKYNVAGDTTGEFVIKNCDITGNIYAALAFYVAFWKTDLQFSALKDGEVAHNNFWDERIGFTPNLKTMTATISIRHN